MKLIQFPLIETLIESDFSTNNQNFTSLADAAGESQERDAALYSLDVHPDGTRVACGGRLADATGVIFIWRMPVLSDIHSTSVKGADIVEKGEKSGRTPKLNKQIVAHNGLPRDGNSAVTASEDTAPVLLSRLCHQLRCVNAVRWSNHGQFLASGSDDRSVFIYHLTPASTSAGSSLSNGQASVGGSKSLEHWYVHKSLSAHHGDVLGLAWSPTDRYLASCSIDNHIVLYDVFKNFAFRSFPAHASLVRSIAFDPVNKYLVSQSDDRSVKIWQYTTTTGGLTSSGTQIDARITPEVTIDRPFKDARPHDLPFLRLAWSTCGAFVVAPNSRNGKIPAAQLIYRKPKLSSASSANDKSAQGWNTSTDLIAASSPIAICRFSPRLYVCRIDSHAGVDRIKALAADADTSAGKLAKRAQPCSTFATASVDGGICVWQQSRVRPIVALERVSRFSISDLSWSSDGYTVFASTVAGDVFCISFSEEELGATLTLHQQRECMLRLYGSLNDDVSNGVNGFHDTNGSKVAAERDEKLASSSNSQALWESIRAERERTLAAEAAKDAAAATTEPTANGNHVAETAASSQAKPSAQPETVERDAKGRRRIKPNFIPPPKVVPFGAPVPNGISHVPPAGVASQSNGGDPSETSSASDVQFLRPSLDWASLQKVRKGRYTDTTTAQSEDAPSSTAVAERKSAGFTQTSRSDNSNVGMSADNNNAVEKAADVEKKTNKRGKRDGAGETKSKKSKANDDKLVAEKAANLDKQHILARTGSMQQTESSSSEISAQSAITLDPHFLQVFSRVAAASGLSDVLAATTSSPKTVPNASVPDLLLKPHAQYDVVNVRLFGSRIRAGGDDAVDSMFQPTSVPSSGDMQSSEIVCINKQNVNGITKSCTSDGTVLDVQNSSEHFGFLKPFISELTQKNADVHCVVTAVEFGPGSAQQRNKTECLWHFTLPSAAVDMVADNTFCAVVCRDNHMQLLSTRSGLQLRPAVALGGAALHKLMLSSNGGGSVFVSVILCNGDVRIWQLSPSSSSLVCVRQTIRCSLRPLIETFFADQNQANVSKAQKWSVSTVRIEQNGTPIVTFTERPYCAYVFDADMDSWLRVESPPQATTAAASTSLAALCSTHDMCTASALYSNTLATSAVSTSGSEAEKLVQFLETQMILTQILHHQQSPLLYQQAVKQFLHVLVARGDVIRVRALMDRILDSSNVGGSSTSASTAAGTQSLFGRKIASATTVAPPSGRISNGTATDAVGANHCALSEDWIAKEILPILTGNIKLRPVFNDLAGRLKLQRGLQATKLGVSSSLHSISSICPDG